MENDKFHFCVIKIHPITKKKFIYINPGYSVRYLLRSSTLQTLVDGKSNVVILEGLNAIDMLYHLVDNKIDKNLPIFNKLYNFIAKNEFEFEIEFNELID